MSLTTPCKDLNELNSLVRQQAELFLKKCNEQGLNIKITETYRSQERQNYLYCQGRTVAQATAKGISSSFAQKYCNPSAQKVTWTLNSNHTGRKAFDICHNVAGDLYNMDVLRKAGAIAKTLGLDWGGDWKETPDYPHFENQSLKSIPQEDIQNSKPTIKVDTAYTQAVKKLNEKGIISNVETWATPSTKHIQTLVEKVGRNIYSTKTYEETIQRLVKQNVITSSQIWLEKTYNENHVMSMVKKLATLY